MGVEDNNPEQQFDKTKLKGELKNAVRRSVDTDAKYDQNMRGNATYSIWSQHIWNIRFYSGFHILRKTLMNEDLETILYKKLLKELGI